MEEIAKMMIDSAKKAPKRAGKRELIKHLEGGKITRSQGVRAKCFDCNGMGESNKCDIVTCPLYPFSPYRQKAAKRPTVVCSK